MSDDEESRTIWCGNLSENVTRDIFYELFLQAGPLEKVRIPRDGEGRQRNFGFVTYIHEESVPYAVDLFQGTTLYDRNLTMRMQRPPDIPRLTSNMAGNFPGLSSFPNSPMPNFMPPIDQNMSQQFMIRMMSGMPNRNNYPQNDYPEKFGSYDNQHMNTNKLSVASLQGNWSSRSSNRDRERSGRRHEPYSNQSREDWRSRDGVRDRDREDRHRHNNDNRHTNDNRHNNDNRNRDYYDDSRDRRRENIRPRNHKHR